MFLKLFVSTTLLFLLYLRPSFAEVVQVRTNEPESKYLGFKVDLKGRDFVDKFPVAPGKFVLIDKGLADVRIKKDKESGLHKFYALVPYRVRINGANPSDLKFLYVQCPVTRETYIDRSPPPKEEVIDGEVRTVFPIDYEVLATELLDPGSYSFLSSPEYPISQFSQDFPMTGRVDQFIPIEAMCVKIEVAHAQYQWDETFRRIMLAKFGISE